MSKRPMEAESPPQESSQKEGHSNKKVFSPVKSPPPQPKSALKFWCTDSAFNYIEIKSNRNLPRDRKSSLMLCIEWPESVQLPHSIDALVEGARTAFRDCNYYSHQRMLRMLVFSNSGEHGSKRALQYLNRVFGLLPQIEWMSDWKAFNDRPIPEVIVSIDNSLFTFELSGDFVNETTVNGCGPGDHFQSTDPEFGLSTTKFDHKVASSDCGSAEVLQTRLLTLRALCDAASWNLKVQNVWRQHHGTEVTRTHTTLTHRNYGKEKATIPNHNSPWPTLPSTLLADQNVENEKMLAWWWWWWWWHSQPYEYVES